MEGKYEINTQEHTAQNNLENSNEKKAIILLNSLMFPYNKQTQSLETREDYNKINVELQKELTLVFSQLGIKENIEKKLQGQEDENQRLETIAQEVFSYSYTREHSPFHTQFLEDIKTGKYGFNCEMSTAMLNEALTSFGYSPRALKANWFSHLFEGGEHYLSCIERENELFVLDLYKYSDTQNNPHFFSINRDEAVTKNTDYNGGTLIDTTVFLDYKNGDLNQFYMYPKGINYDILQTLKVLDEIKKEAPFSEEAGKIVQEHPEIKTFDYDKLKSKLQLFDPKDLFEKQSL